MEENQISEINEATETTENHTHEPHLGFSDGELTPEEKQAIINNTYIFYNRR